MLSNDQPHQTTQALTTSGEDFVMSNPHTCSSGKTSLCQVSGSKKILAESVVRGVLLHSLLVRLSFLWKDFTISMYYNSCMNSYILTYVCINFLTFNSIYYFAHFVVFSLFPPKNSRISFKIV